MRSASLSFAVVDAHQNVFSLERLLSLHMGGAGHNAHGMEGEGLSSCVVDAASLSF